MVYHRFKPRGWLGGTLTELHLGVAVPRCGLYSRRDGGWEGGDTRPRGFQGMDLTGLGVGGMEASKRKFEANKEPC